MRSREADTGAANASSAARYGYAAFLIALFVGLGWIVPIVGLVAPTGVAVTIMMLAPVACGWAPAAQGAVAAAGIVGYGWCVASTAALPERLPSVMVALGISVALPSAEAGPYCRVVAGKGACPPEDVGGIGGYYSFLEAVKNPKHPRHHDMLEWCGGHFDPDAFDPDDINISFQPRRPRRKDA